jgi:hypothetical protein
MSKRLSSLLTLALAAPLAIAQTSTWVPDKAHSGVDRLRQSHSAWRDQAGGSAAGGADGPSSRNGQEASLWLLRYHYDQPHGIRNRDKIPDGCSGR